MKQIIRSGINRLLRPLNLKLVSAFRNQLHGESLEHDLRLLIHAAEPLCIDVGANRGQTIDLLQGIFEKTEIHAFEPSTRMFEYLTGNYANDRVFVYNQGVGDKKGIVEFNNLSDTTMSSVLKLVNIPWSSNEKDYECELEEVQMTTIDDFVKQKNINQVDLLKSDAQGYDLNVLKGAKKSLNTKVVKYVLVEILFMEMYEKQGKYTDYFEFLESCGFYLIDLYEKIRHPEQNGTISWCTALFGRRDNDSVVQYLPPF